MSPAWSPRHARSFPSGAPGCEAGVALPIQSASPLDRARAYISKVRWQYAKTMPEWPHEYTIRSWQPDLENEFEAFAVHVRHQGVVRPWPEDSPNPRYWNTYLEIDGWEYWTMGAPIGETTVINRARLGPVTG